MHALTYATRRSSLALAQSRAFVETLRRAAPQVELRELSVVTSGDRIQDRPLFEVGGKGLFVKEIEDALLDGRADFAVHSLKDVPGALPAGLVLGCVPARQDARDVLVAPRYRTLDALPSGARVGTSSLRRAVALRGRRSDLRVEPLRGNVDTRLRKVRAGEYDAIVLAYAGVARLGLLAEITEILDAGVFLPAPGQGALGIECRQGDGRTRGLVGKLHDPQTAVCVAAERAVLVALGGDCKTPLGAYADRVDDTLRLRAFVATDGESVPRSGERRRPWPANEEEAFSFGLALGEGLGASPGRTK